MERFIHYRIKPEEYSDVAFSIARDGGSFIRDALPCDILLPISYFNIYKRQQIEDFNSRMRTHLFKEFGTYQRHSRHYIKRHREYLERSHYSKKAFYEKWLSEGVI